VFGALRQRIRRFMSAPSGTRFRAHHERMQQQPSVMRTLIAIGVGLLLLALGLIMLVLPGPGLLVAAIGAAIIAGESLTAARVLDRLDAWVTRIWKRWRR
jgi:hypothetical protein